MKKIITLAIILLALTLTLTACQSNEQFYGSWGNITAQSTPIEGTSVEFEIKSTMIISDDESFSFAITLVDAEGYAAKLMAVLDGTKESLVASSGATEEEYDAALEAELGVSWEAYLEVMAQSQLEVLNEQLEAFSFTGTWEADGTTLTLYTGEGDAAEVYDILVLEEDVLTTLDGISFTKGA